MKYIKQHLHFLQISNAGHLKQNVNKKLIGFISFKDFMKCCSFNFWNSTFFNSFSIIASIYRLIFPPSFSIILCSHLLNGFTDRICFLFRWKDALKILYFFPGSCFQFTPNTKNLKRSYQKNLVNKTLASHTLFNAHRSKWLIF